MSDTHKAALAEGRDQGRAVRRYLEALEAHKPRRGRKRTPESMEKRLAAIEEKLPQADPLTRLQLVQERMDLQRQLEAADTVVDLQELEDEFVKAAPDYSRRKGITYAAWREAGVDPAVLRRAGIRRAGGAT
jgi:transposase